MNALNLSLSEAPQEAAAIHTVDRALITEPENPAILRAAGVLADEDARRRRRVWGASMALVGYAALLALCMVWLVQAGAGSGLINILAAIGAVSALFGPACLAATFAIPSRRLREAMRSLASHQDAAAVGPLLEAYDSLSDPVTKTRLRGALIAALGNLKASDAGMLSDRHQRLLRGLLREPLKRSGRARALFIGREQRRQWTEFSLAAIRALEQVGDERALPIVERLARIRATSGSRAQIREAAKEALPALKMRVESASRQNALLRAAAPDEAAVTLLRPNSDAPTEPDLLLMPASSPDR